MNILDFAHFKSENRHFSMVTCYDFWSAQLTNQSPIDVILVGDSLGMVMHGYDTTLPVAFETMLLHTKAVVKGAPNKFIVADMPFGSYRISQEQTMRYAIELMQAGASAIKLEGALGNLDTIKHMVESGIPVMGHIGLTPQSVNTLGGFKVQGRGNKKAVLLSEHAKQLEDAGCFCVVLECVPAFLAKTITDDLSIPTIGIGAGPDTTGQVLVLHDLLGFTQHKAKFVKNYLKGEKLIRYALKQYHEEVVSQSYPEKAHCYED